MLTLTRKIGEAIIIGDDIRVIVKEIRSNQIRLGIVAPKNVLIYREELIDGTKPPTQQKPDKKK